MTALKIASVFRPGLLAGKSAIVTGGGTGIGKAISLELMYLGCEVMIAARNVERLQTSAEEMRAAVPASRLEYTHCNLRKLDTVSQLVDTTLEKFGKIDILVNNGGGHFRAQAEDITKNGWNAVIEANLTGPFFLTQHVYNRWMCDHGGAVVNILVDMWKGYPGMSHSGAARAAEHNLTKSLAVEWAPSGIRVNSVCPGSSIYSESANATYGTGSNIFEVQIPRIPAKRLGTVEEVSAAVVFLLSPAAAFITGESIQVDGGHVLYTTSQLWEVPDHKKLPAYTWEDDAKKNSSKL